MQLQSSRSSGGLQSHYIIFQRYRHFGRCAQRMKIIPSRYGKFWSKCMRTLIWFRDFCLHTLDFNKTKSNNQQWSFGFRHLESVFRSLTAKPSKPANAFPSRRWSEDNEWLHLNLYPKWNLRCAQSNWPFSDSIATFRLHTVRRPSVCCNFSSL